MVPGITLRTRGGGECQPPPPLISARSGPIFKKSDSMVFYGAKELTCQILAKLGRKHGLLFVISICICQNMAIFRYP